MTAGPLVSALFERTTRLNQRPWAVWLQVPALRVILGAVVACGVLTSLAWLFCGPMEAVEPPPSTRQQS